MGRFGVAILLLLVLINKNFGQTNGNFFSMDTLQFSVDLSNSKYKPANCFLGCTYTINGNKANDSVPENSFIIGVLPNLENTFEARKKFAQAYIKKYKEVVNSIVQENETVINGMKGYEVYYFDTDTINHKVVKFKTYGVIFGNSEKTIGFLGMACSHYNKTIKQFREIARTIKVK